MQGPTRWCAPGSFVTIFCALVVAARGARAEEAGRQVVLEEQKVVRSSLFDAEMVLLRVAGHRAFVLKPPAPKADRPQPWVWYAPTLLADREADWKSPGERHAWVFTRLLAAGVYVAGVDVGESWGSPAGRAVYDAFYDGVVRRFGFSPKARLFCVSRGGLFAYNWASERPERVQCIGGIYPLVNLRTYRGIAKVAEAYGMSEEQLRAELEKHNPIDRLATLAARRVPIFHVHGDRDEAVPLETNSAELVRRYQALGGPAELVVIPGKGHEVAPELWQEARLVEFLVRGR
jgi:pimeloyl-ACP methyl ester carboxylesterase